MLFHLLKDWALFFCLLLGSLLAGPVQVVRQDSVIHGAAGACEGGTHVCDCPAHFTVFGLPETRGWLRAVAADSSPSRVQEPEAQGWAGCARGRQWGAPPPGLRARCIGVWWHGPNATRSLTCPSPPPGVTMSHSACSRGTWGEAPFVPALHLPVLRSQASEVSRIRRAFFITLLWTRSWGWHFRGNAPSRLETKTYEVGTWPSRCAFPLVTLDYFKIIQMYDFLKKYMIVIQAISNYRSFLWYWPRGILSCSSVPAAIVAVKMGTAVWYLQAVWRHLFSSVPSRCVAVGWRSLSSLYLIMNLLPLTHLP